MHRDELEAKIASYEGVLELLFSRNGIMHSVEETIITFAQKWGVSIDYLVGVSLGSHPDYVVTERDSRRLYDDFVQGVVNGQDNRYKFRLNDNRYLAEYLTTHFIDTMKADSNPVRVIKALLIEDELYSNHSYDLDIRNIAAWSNGDGIYAMDETIAQQRRIHSADAAAKDLKKDQESNAGEWMCIEDLKVGRLVYMCGRIPSEKPKPAGNTSRPSAVSSIEYAKLPLAF